MVGNSDRYAREHVIRLRRGDNSDYLLPKKFFSILIRRFFPVMSLVYLVSVFCIAISTGHLVHFILYDNIAFLRGTLVASWCAFPGVVWILLAAHPMFRHTANLSYKIIAGVMLLTIALSCLLFPEMEMYGMRNYLILSFPAFFLMYYLLIIDPLPLELVYPLNALGVCAVIWAFSVEAIMDVPVGDYLQAVH
ncbi:MAG: hypothetical protein KAJ40_03745 [Alphaproteobacteria bacterium]|nr:hypothetical protein [Alphaproteobacteria bacterium]